MLAYESVVKRHVNGVVVRKNNRKQFAPGNEGEEIIRLTRPTAFLEEVIQSGRIDNPPFTFFKVMQRRAKAPDERIGQFGSRPGRFGSSLHLEHNSWLRLTFDPFVEMRQIIEVLLHLLQAALVDVTGEFPALEEPR